ncbi:hypothetical protein [Sanguibacter antarcticus]|uniref:Uncharacterized protein n=1 Tax=Sanguibacter antarcticus TaxID=372484 RepID=A0A2A9DZJ8_9MICO|nr:hypothetical protein [Sanguibacter antarcticus]PFG32227.1 hypothetical protein ATL42_0046 [Sanguibacter antarcticus]
MSADQPRSEPTPWIDAWSAALDGFEMSLAEAEDLVSTGHLIDSAFESANLAWSPPTDLGPLPPALKDRATAILDRQLEMASRLAEAARSARQHLTVVDNLRDRRPSVPVYIDLVG